MPPFVPYDYTSAIGCPSVDEQPCPSVVPDSGSVFHRGEVIQGLDGVGDWDTIRAKQYPHYVAQFSTAKFGEHGHMDFIRHHNFNDPQALLPLHKIVHSW